MGRRLFVPGLAVLVIAAAGGCGPEGPRTYEVTGSVTLDDQPLPAGDIIFFPEEKEFGPDAGTITDGQYRVQVKGGKKKVQIRATRPVPGKKGPMGEEAIEDYIPARYNARTELGVEVGAGRTRHDFALQSR
jgi:hypothetical protein